MKIYFFSYKCVSAFKHQPIFELCGSYISHKHNLACNVYSVLYILTLEWLLHMYEILKVLLNLKVNNLNIYMYFMQNSNINFYLFLKDPLKLIHVPQAKKQL